MVKQNVSFEEHKPKLLNREAFTKVLLRIPVVNIDY